MAKAEAKKETVITGITLELTLEEAKTLRSLTGNVQGESANTRRKHTDRIWDALVKAGVQTLGYGSLIQGSYNFPVETNIPD